MGGRVNSCQPGSSSRIESLDPVSTNSPEFVQRLHVRDSRISGLDAGTRGPSRLFRSRDHRWVHRLYTCFTRPRLTPGLHRSPAPQVRRRRDPPARGPPRLAGPGPGARAAAVGGRRPAGPRRARPPPPRRRPPRRARAARRPRGVAPAGEDASGRPVAAIDKRS